MGLVFFVGLLALVAEISIADDKRSVSALVEDRQTSELAGRELMMTSWWMLWHQRRTDMTRVAQAVVAMPVAVQTGSAAVVGEEVDLLEASPADAPDMTSYEEKVEDLQKVEDNMKERLRVYWEYLSNATLNHQPWPRVKNADLHSDGIINNAMTATIEFDRPDDEEKLVSKYWFRFSSDCTDMGKLDATLPPVLILQVDPYIDRYRALLGPVRVPENSRCLMIYAADFNSQPFPEPVALLLPQFKYPKPEVNYASHCKTGMDGCFESGTSNGTSCESLMGKNCCSLRMCVGCKECSQVRNLEAQQIRPRLYAVEPKCTDRWDRQGFAKIYGFTCEQALAWGYMRCQDDVTAGFCRKTCFLCDPNKYILPPGPGAPPEKDKSPALPDPNDLTH